MYSHVTRSALNTHIYRKKLSRVGLELQKIQIRYRRVSRMIQMYGRLIPSPRFQMLPYTERLCTSTDMPDRRPELSTIEATISKAARKKIGLSSGHFGTSSGTATTAIEGGRLQVRPIEAHCRRATMPPELEVLSKVRVSLSLSQR